MDEAQRACEKELETALEEIRAQKEELAATRKLLDAQEQALLTGETAALDLLERLRANSKARPHLTVVK